jgi:hypothetical protein
MTNNDYLQFKKVLIGSVIAVILSAGMTALAFYYSTTNTLINVNKRLDQHDQAIQLKLERREFDRYLYECEKRESAIEKKFDAIDEKLDWLIKHK